MVIEYPDVAWGMEVDTPSWLALIPNGLNAPEHQEWGDWGGRYELYKPDFVKLKKGNSRAHYEPESRVIWTNAIDTYRLINRRILGGMKFSIPFRLPIIKSLFGVGVMIFKMILLPAWIGLQNLIRRPIIHRFRR